MHRDGADFDVERLLERAAARCPELGEFQDQVLKRHRRIPFSTRTDFNSFSRCNPMSARCAPSSSLNARGETGTSPSANGLSARTHPTNAPPSRDIHGTD